VPGFQELSNAIIAFVDDSSVIIVNDIVMGPCMICNPGAFGRCFDVPDVFFFPRDKGCTSFTDISPRTVSTRNFIDNVRF
jgi:hypothetical protein